MSLDNLQLVYEQAHRAEIHEGNCAYFRYHFLLEKMAKRHAVSIQKVCGIFSALSPNNDYWGNLRDACKMLAAHERVLSIDQFTVSTYGSNKRKAWRILNGELPMDLIVAPKTRNFYLNLVDPTDTKPVTIDGHVYNIWHGSRLPLQSRDPDQRIPRVTGKLYDEIARDVRSLAFRHSIIPHQAQATIWLVWRRIHGIQGGAQLSFWDRDAEYSGLGFTKFEVTHG